MWGKSGIGGIKFAEVKLTSTELVAAVNKSAKMSVNANALFIVSQYLFYV